MNLGWQVVVSYADVLVELMEAKSVNSGFFQAVKGLG